MPIFQCLFLLESTDFFILEIKRTDISENSSPSDRFKWLKVEKIQLNITCLHFKSMDSSGDIEERFFEEGFLKFDSIEGTFIEKFNTAQYALKRIASADLKENEAQQITKFLAELPLPHQKAE